MTKKLFTLLAAAAFTMGTLQAQTRKIEEVKKAPSAEDLTISYTKYKLSNGLTVIIHEDHSDPIVHVDVTYHVGSAREEIGRSGFAHFFEHMMFQGSKHVGDDEHFKIVSGAGGTMNGTTNRDRTNYFETLPKNYLETALWLEADRMGFLLEAVNQQKFEVQRSTVKNEKGQNYENRPYGMASEITYQNLYPYGHPYSWSTIGYVKDLDAANVEDLKKFFLRWYGPNNAVVTVGGDVSTEQALALVEKYFGSIPAGPEVERMQPEYYSLEKDRYVSYEDNVRFPMLRVTFPSVPTYHEDEAALDILAEILGQGKASLLYQNVVKTKKGMRADVYNSTSELGGEFVMQFQAFPEGNLADMQKLMQDAIAEFARRGVTQEDLDKAKGSRQADFIYSLESVSGKASLLASYETFTGNANYIRQDLERYQKVTKNDIMRVFDTYIKNQHALYLSIVPKGKTALVAAADNYKPTADPSKIVHEDMSKLSLREVKDNFDRKKKPKPGASPVVNMPQYITKEAPNGVKLISAINTEVPIAYMNVKIKAGQLYEPAGKEGIAYLTAQMLQESTQKLTAEQVNNEMEKLGSSIRIGADGEEISATVRMLKKNIPPTLGLMTEVLFHPKFDAEEFDRVKRRQLEDIANLGTQASAMANVAYGKMVYGQKHPLGSYILGTANSVANITLEDVKNYFTARMKPSNISVVLSGDIDKMQLEMMSHAFVALPPTPPHLNPQGEAAEKGPELPASPKIEKTKIYLVNKPGAPQSEIRVGYLSLPYDADGEFFKATVMNYLLGGSFNSRINMKLREEKGWTYGARSYFTGTKLPGTFTVSTGVRADATDSSVYYILKEMNQYRDKGISKKELAYTKASILEREALKYETNAQKAGYVERLQEYNLPYDYVTTQVKTLNKLKKKDIKKLAQKYLPMDNMVIVVVGDAAKHREGLKGIAAKYGIEVVDAATGNTTE